MAPQVDLSWITQKQQELAAQQAARSLGGVPYWNPADGTSKIRLGPPWADNVRSFEKEINMHFGVGPDELVFTCPGPGCPICAHVAALRATGDPTDKEMASRMGVKKRYYSNIVDLNDPVWTQKDYTEFKTAKPNEEPSWAVGQTKVQIFGYGASIYGQLINLFAQLQEDLTNLASGFDLIITRVGQKMQTKYTVITAGRPTPFQAHGELVLHNLDAVNLPRKHEDMLAALAGTAPPGGAALPPNYGAAPPAMPAPAPQQVAALPPPPVTPPVAPLPPKAASAPAAAPAAAQAPKPAPAPKAPAQVQSVAPVAPPSCFKDKTTFSETDVECIGGELDGEQVDKCPFFQECGEFSGKLVAAPKASRRRGGAAAAPAPSPSGGDGLEQQMLAALNGTRG